MLDEIKNILKSIRIESSLTESMLTTPKLLQEAGKGFRNQTLSMLNNQHKNTQSKIIRLIDLYLEESITKSEYDKNKLKYQTLINQCRHSIK